MNKSFLLLILTILLFSCAPKTEVNQKPAEFIASLPQVIPQNIAQFNALDSLYLQHIAYNSIVLENGTFVLGDRGSARLYLINKKGNLVKVLSRKGRGPGEFLDVSLKSSLDGGILVYDQTNEKVVVYNKKAEYVTEALVKPFEKKMVISGVYAGGNKGEYIVKLKSMSWYYDNSAEPFLLLSVYNAQTEGYVKSKQYRTKRYARRYIAGNMVGGHAVPYYPSQIIRFNPQTDTYFLFWTNSNMIAEVNAHLDTLRTIPVDIPRQAVSKAEIDSVKKEYPEEQFPKMQEIVPDFKTPVKNMFIDEKGRFWLRLNYRGETQKWVILNKKGDPQKIVSLPHGMVTHISVHHIGLRLNPHTFALFEPVE